VWAEISLDIDAPDDTENVESTSLGYSEKFNFEVSSKPPRRAGMTEIPSREPDQEGGDAGTPRAD
jgi:hypothetical protein